MKKLFYVFLFLILSSVSFGQWAKNVGGTSGDYGRSIADDSLGNVYITGHYSGTADFDPSTGTANLSNAGNNDIFFAKYSSDGSLVWAKGIGNTGDDVSLSISLVNNSYFIIAGYFMGTVDFDPGAGITNLTAQASPYYDAFFAKYDSSGNLIWVKQLVCNASSHSAIENLKLDINGNIYVSGILYGTADFDPDAGTTNLSSGGNNNLFFAKYNSSGGIIWAKNIGNTSTNYIKDIDVDGSSNLLITGYYSGTLDLDPGSGVSNLVSAGGQDIFFAKYSNSDGSLLWDKSIGGSGSDNGYGISVDNSNNVYITGLFNGTVDFNPGTSTNNLTSTGGANTYLAKYSTDGNFVWTENISGTATGNFGVKIFVDNTGNIYLTGSFYSTIDLDPGTGITNITSAGGQDIYFAKYSSSDGSFVWGKGIGGSGTDNVIRLTKDINNYLYLVGYFNGTADFDPVGSSLSLISAGGYDVFFTKYSSTGTLPVELSSFTASVSGNNINLKWQTATEVNNYGFQVERKDGRWETGDGRWEKIGFVAGHGNSNSPHEYSFSDLPAGGTSFSYRLKQIDIDGHYKYYDAITVSLFSSTKAKLMQNSPNPFNPSTAIKFFIPDNSDVTIKIYDMLGREVTTLINQQSTAGYHIVYWNGRDSYGRDAASGVYLYRLTAGNFVETKKMLMMR